MNAEDNDLVEICHITEIKCKMLAKSSQTVAKTH